MLRIAFIGFFALGAAACSKTEPVAQQGVAVSTETVGTEGAPAKGLAKASVKSAVAVRSDAVPTSASKAAASARPSATKKSTRGDIVAPVPEGTEIPPFTGRRVSLIHTANMIGEIEPCG
jgi:hypothetical protein